MAVNTRSKSSSGNSLVDEEKNVSLSQVKELMKTQESAFKAALSAFMENTNKRFDSLTKELSEVKVSLEFTQKQVADLANSNANSLKQKSEEIYQSLNEIRDKADDLENRSRRNNLCFDGIPEQQQESWDDCEARIQELINNKLGIETPCIIERAHRVGRKQAGRSRPRTIVAKFLSYKAREAILKARKNLKGTNIYVREDFSDIVNAKRRELLPKLKEARQQGSIAYLRYDKLVILPRRSYADVAHGSPLQFGQVFNTSQSP